MICNKFIPVIKKLEPTAHIFCDLYVAPEVSSQLTFLLFNKIVNVPSAAISILAEFSVPATLKYL
jgi:hypothetical protein